MPFCNGKADARLNSQNSQYQINEKRFGCVDINAELHQLNNFICF